jgi:hypothetical protein
VLVPTVAVLSVAIHRTAVLAVAAVVVVDGSVIQARLEVVQALLAMTVDQHFNMVAAAAVVQAVTVATQFLT